MVHWYQKPLKNECHIKDGTNYFQEAPNHILPTNFVCPERKVAFLMFFSDHNLHLYQTL
jgi:hypothetical protein